MKTAIRYYTTTEDCSCPARRFRSEGCKHMDRIIRAFRDGDEKYVKLQAAFNTRQDGIDDTVNISTGRYWGDWEHLTP